MMTTNAPEEKKKYYFDFFLFIGLIVSIILLVYDCQKKIEPNNFITLSHTGALKKYGSIKQNIVLDCIADGYPKPSITWFYHSTYTSYAINTHSLDDNKFQLYNGSLKIINLLFRDEGHYTCEAKNTFGSKIIVYDLLVDKPYIDEYLDPSLLSITPAEQQNIDRNMFDDVTLKCNATGKTTPTVAWYYNNKQIGQTNNGEQWEFSDKNKFLLRNGDLRIIDLSLDDGGHYRCEAINKYGLKSIWYSLTVKPIESKYQWISSDERRANFANRKLMKFNSVSSNYIGRVDEYMACNFLAIVSLNTGIASYSAYIYGKRNTTNYELLEVYGNYEWKKVIDQAVPHGAVELNGLRSLIGREDNYSITTIDTNGYPNYKIYEYYGDVEILVVT